MNLKLHPDSTCAAVTRIDVDAARDINAVRLRYIVHGDIGALRLPAPTAPARVDELWKHTCFEAFVRPAGGDAYVEFNLSPASQWAAHAFDAYRSGMRDLDTPPPRIETSLFDDRIELRAVIAAPPQRYLVGLSAVIEEMNGAKSYWALAHPPGKPDFHHSDCFAFELPPA